TEIPASPVFTNDDFRAPGLTFVFADRSPDPGRHQAVAVDRNDPAIRHRHQDAWRPEIVDARQKAPGLPSVIAAVDLAPHHSGMSPLEEHDTADADIGQPVSAREEPAMTNEGDTRVSIVAGRLPPGIHFGHDVAHEVEFPAFVDTAEDQGTAVG